MDKMSVGITGPPHMLLSNKNKVYTVNFKLKNCLKNVVNGNLVDNSRCFHTFVSK